MKRTACLKSIFLLIVVGFSAPEALLAQDGPLTVESLSEAPPEEVSDTVKAVLGSEAIRVVDGQGEPFADFWIREGVPVRGKPSGPEGAVLFPVLQVGQLIGVVRFNEEAYDYRDQPILAGTYSLRYGLQPINGDHLGVSTYRDYLMLVPIADESDLEPIEQDTLDILSADAAMTNHPAVFLLSSTPDGTEPFEALHNEEKDQWGVALPVPVQANGEESTETLQVQVILVGRGPV